MKEKEDFYLNSFVLLEQPIHNNYTVEEKCDPC